jgi:hypothetical protein
LARTLVTDSSWTRDAIAAKIGVSHMTIYRELKRAGISKRSTRTTALARRRATRLQSTRPWAKWTAEPASAYGNADAKRRSCVLFHWRAICRRHTIKYSNDIRPRLPDDRVHDLDAAPYSHSSGEPIAAQIAERDLLDITELHTRHVFGKRLAVAMVLLAKTLRTVKC